MNNGWISIHRKFKDWEWYNDSKIVHLFLHCLLSANHKPKKWRGAQIEAGQFITSQTHLAEDTGLSVRQVRTILDKLKLTGELTVKITNKYSIISITNWDSYQGVDRLEVTPVTTKRQSNDTQLTTNNNVNNNNNEDNDNKDLKDLFDSFWKNYPKKSDKKKAEVSFNRLGKEKKEKAIIDCKTRFSNTDKQYIPLATTYINGERWNDEMPKAKKDNHSGFQEKDYQKDATPQSQLGWMNDEPS